MLHDELGPRRVAALAVAVSIAAVAAARGAAARAEEAPASRAAAASGEAAPPPVNDDGWNASLGYVPGHPPPGSPGDVALWQRLVDEQNAVVASRAQATELLWKLHHRRHDEQLAQAAAGAQGEARERLVELRRRLLTRWDAAHATLTRQWPVDPRLGCRAERLDLEGAMEAKLPELDVVREQAKVCVRKMSFAVDAMKAADRDLAEAIAAAESALAAQGVSVPARAVTASTTPPPPPAQTEGK